MIDWNNVQYFSRLKYLQRVQDSSFFGRFDEDYFSQNWYAAFCNNAFRVDKGNSYYLASWRSAAADVADIRLCHGYNEEYTNWYCSGIGFPGLCDKYVEEGTITDEIRNCLVEIGFEEVPDFYPKDYDRITD